MERGVLISEMESEYASGVYTTEKRDQRDRKEGEREEKRRYQRHSQWEWQDCSGRDRREWPEGHQRSMVHPNH
jgi:hypothetical protein